jgi:hypothetical protein
MDSEMEPSGPSSGLVSRASGSGVGAGRNVRNRLGVDAEAVRAAAKTALPSSQGSGWTEGSDMPFTPFTDGVSPPLHGSAEKGGLGGGYFELAYEKGGRRQSGGRLGKGTLIVEEEEEAKEGEGELMVAVLPKTNAERRGMSFAEALMDLEGSGEDEEDKQNQKATRSKGSR